MILWAFPAGECECETKIAGVWLEEEERRGLGKRKRQRESEREREKKKPSLSTSHLWNLQGKKEHSVSPGGLLDDPEMDSHFLTLVHPNRWPLHKTPASGAAQSSLPAFQLGSLTPPVWCRSLGKSPCLSLFWVFSVSEVVWVSREVSRFYWGQWWCALAGEEEYFWLQQY
jgi:hypothetical protein